MSGKSKDSIITIIMKYNIVDYDDYICIVNVANLNIDKQVLLSTLQEETDNQKSQILKFLIKIYQQTLKEVSQILKTNFTNENIKEESYDIENINNVLFLD